MGRRLTKVISGETCVVARWTEYCTGCCELGDYGSGSENYPWDEKAKCLVGSGCHECGYTGKRRREMWVPAWTEEDPKL